MRNWQCANQRLYRNSASLNSTIHSNFSDSTVGLKDGCITGTTGILCSVCAPGFHRDVVTCVKCQDETVGVRVTILFILFCGSFIVLAFFRKNLRTKWRKYRPLYRDVLRIFAIVVTFQQINTSLPSIIEVPWPTVFSEFVAKFAIVNIDVFSIAGVGCVGEFNFILNFLGMMSLPGSIILWAACSLAYARKMMSNRIAGMSSKDRNLQEEEALHMLFHIADKDAGGHICASELGILLRQLGWNVTTRDAHKVIETFVSHGEEWKDEEGRIILDEGTFVASMLSGRMSAVLKQKNHSLRKTRTRSMSFSVLRSDSSINVDPSNIKKSKGSDKSNESEVSSLLCDSDRLVRWILGKRIFANSLAGATSLLMLSHTPVSRKVFQFFHCHNLAGRFFLFADYSLECYNDTWFAFLPVVLFVLFAFTVALPASISLYIFLHRGHLYSASVQQVMGWLWTPYRRGVEFWQVHDVVLKMILTGLLIYIPMTARTAVASMVSIN